MGLPNKDADKSARSKIMSFMVALILIIFYFVGTYAFHETGISHALPYAAVTIVIVDLLLARLLRRRRAASRAGDSD